MSPDRTGEPLEDTGCRDPRCGNGCPKRWLGYDSEGRPIPCLRCKPHLLNTTYAARKPLGEVNRNHGKDV